jgi:hypothetical protein
MDLDECLIEINKKKHIQLLLKYINCSTVKPAHVVTSIKQSPVYKGRAWVAQ